MVEQEKPRSISDYDLKGLKNEDRRELLEKALKYASLFLAGGVAGGVAVKHLARSEKVSIEAASRSREELLELLKAQDALIKVLNQVIDSQKELLGVMSVEIDALRKKLVPQTIPQERDREL